MMRRSRASSGVARTLPHQSCGRRFTSRWTAPSQTAGAWNRFRIGDFTNVTSRFRTTPAVGALTPLRFAFASCQHDEAGLFTASLHMAAEELELVSHLGDDICEAAGVAGRVRRHDRFECRSLEDYRRRYAQHELDPLLQVADARAKIVTWDDHEVDDDCAGDGGEVVFRAVMADRAHPAFRRRSRRSVRKSECTITIAGMCPAR